MSRSRQRVELESGTEAGPEDLPRGAGSGAGWGVAIRCPACRLVTVAVGGAAGFQTDEAAGRIVDALCGRSGGCANCLAAAATLYCEECAAGAARRGGRLGHGGKSRGDRRIPFVTSP